MGRSPRGQSPWTLQELTHALGIPMHSVNAVLDALSQGGLLSQSNDTPPAYLPARDLSQVAVAQVLATARAAGEDEFLNPDSLPRAAPVKRVMESVESAIAQSTAVNVSSLVDGVGLGEIPPGNPAPPMAPDEEAEQ